MRFYLWSWRRRKRNKDEEGVEGGGGGMQDGGLEGEGKEEKK